MNRRLETSNKAFCKFLNLTILQYSATLPNCVKCLHMWHKVKYSGIHYHVCKYILSVEEFAIKAFCVTVAIPIAIAFDMPLHEVDMPLLPLHELDMCTMCIQALCNWPRVPMSSPWLNCWLPWWVSEAGKLNARRPEFKCNQARATPELQNVTDTTDISV